MKLVFFTFLFIINSSSAFCRDTLIIANSIESSIDKISLSELKLLYYKRANVISGVTLEPRDQADLAVKARFYREFFDKSLGQIDNFWAIQVFRGRKSPPSSLGSKDNHAMVKWFQAHPNSIGYIEKRFLTKKLKEVPVLFN